MVLKLVISELKLGLKEIKEDIIQSIRYSIIIAIASIIMGFIAYTATPAIACEDSITIWLESKIIAAYDGIPMYRWFHTPLYNYFLWVVNFLTNDNTMYIKVFQIFLHAISSFIVFMAFRQKLEKKIAFISSIFYACSYFAILTTQTIHQEAFLEPFFVLTLYFLFKYDKSFQDKKTAQPIWIWLSSLALGVSFFTKETSIIVLLIYYVYSLLFNKTKMRDYIFCVILLAIFILPFLYVQYQQDWFILRLYLSPEGDSFLSRQGIMEIGKFFTLIMYDLIPIVLSYIFVIKLFIEFIKEKKVKDLYIIAFIIVLYSCIIIISRSGALHMMYILFFYTFLSGPSIYYISDMVLHKINVRRSKKEVSQVARPNLTKRKLIDTKTTLIISIFIVNLALIVPNLILLKINNNTQSQAFSYVSSVVQNNITYSQIHDGIGYYIENYYSDYSWYNSYKRNGFTSWQETDVFELTDMQNITDYGIQLIIRFNKDVANEFLEEITTNGTLNLISEQSFTFRDNYWSQPYINTYRIYEVI